jgi:hypothetical protein
MSKSDITIIEQDRINLTQDQKNLIELAFRKEVPVEDAKVMEMIHKGVYVAGPPSVQIPINEKENVKFTDHPYNRLMSYFIEKYGLDFGMLYLAAITGGEKQYKDAKKTLERMKAVERIEKQKK